MEIKNKKISKKRKYLLSRIFAGIMIFVEHVTDNIMYERAKMK